MTHPGQTPEPSSPTRQTTPTLPDPSSPFAHGTPYDTPPYGVPKVEDEPSSGRGVARHVLSLLIGLVLTPVAIGGFDWAFGRYWYDAANFRSFQDGETWPFAVAGVSALLLLIVAAAGRLSPVGPAIAAVLYGAVPAVVIVLARDEVFRAGRELGGYDWSYPNVLVNMPFYGFVLFPTIAALLLGTAIASAGRRRR
ncbi:hypothetical protein [Mumia sp. DW29H23]|uniref:hypothetical protein n=1 Tax=Mumia sp. DW29H23 TaxID=3421241 RepID=UPI003D699A13